MWFLAKGLVVLLLATVSRAASVLASPPRNITLPPSLNSSSALQVNRISFQDTVREAVLSTVAQYPGAIFVSIQASTTGDPTNDPRRLTDIRLIFEIPNRLPSRIIIVTMSQSWGRWLRPELSPSPPPVNHGALPYNLGMDLLEADQLIKEHGYTQKYWWVNVIWPLEVGRDRMQVYYVFEIDSDEPGTPDAVVVGARDRSVEVINHPAVVSHWIDSGVRATS